MVRETMPTDVAGELASFGGAPLPKSQVFNRNRSCTAQRLAVPDVRKH
jgi:hypothetical protein